jgi:hypothetical protein
MKLRLLFALLIFFVAACQPSSEGTQPPAPTLFTLPTVSPTEAASDTPTLTYTPSATDTPTETPTDTNTPTATDTPTQTVTPSVTPNRTLAAVGSATAAIIERPVFSTFTPPPPGSTLVPNFTPQQIADLVITEQQFREEVDLAFADTQNIALIEVDFVPEGIALNLTAVGGDGAFETHEMLIEVITANGIAQFRGAFLQGEDEPPPSDEFLATANEVFERCIMLLDGILKQRLGEQQNLETIVMTNDEMQISLLVPLP